MRMRRTIAVGLCLGCLFGLAVFTNGCNTAKDPWEGETGSVRVVVSFAPLYCFTKNIAGPDAAVKCLLHGEGPHDYQPVPRDAVLLQKANLFLTNGLELDEGFATKLKNNANNPKLRMVALGEEARLKDRLIDISGEGGGQEHAGHHHGNKDPHLWLGVPEAKLLVESIRDELCQADPAHAENYKQRATSYLQRLTELEKYGTTVFEKKKKEPIIAFHDSLRYFARTYQLTIAGTIEPQPGSDVNQKELAELVQLCAEKKVRLIAVEPQYQRGSAGALIKELKLRKLPNAEAVLVDPLETAEPAELEQLDWYERKIRENLDNLAKAFDAL